MSSTGVNFILPRDSAEVVKVYCDQETSGGGWTLIQRRTDGKEDFNRNWAAYKSGKKKRLMDFYRFESNVSVISAMQVSVLSSENSGWATTTSTA